MVACGSKTTVTKHDIWDSSPFEWKKLLGSSSSRTAWSCKFSTSGSRIGVGIDPISDENIYVLEEDNGNSDIKQEKNCAFKNVDFRPSSTKSLYGACNDTKLYYLYEDDGDSEIDTVYTASSNGGS